MNIVFLTQILPYPLDAGPKIRAYYVLRYLAEAGHRVTLLSFVRESDRPEYLEHLQRYCTEIRTVQMRRSRPRDLGALLRAFLSRRSFLLSRDWRADMARSVREIVGRRPSFDAIHADQLWMAPYALLACKLASREKRPLTVLDQHNAVFRIPERLAAGETRFWKRMLLGMEARTLARCEGDLCRQFDRLVWVSEEDRQAMLAHQGDPRGDLDLQFVIPIGVDPSTRNSSAQLHKRRRVTFVGGLHWPPNAEGVRWFRKRVWPDVKNRVPDAMLTIIGRFGSRQRDMRSEPSVEVTGYVADPHAYMEETAVFIVPVLAGGGLRVKILDAWSRELPVVSTRIGAEGLHARHGENLYLADDPASFAAAVIDLMTDRQLAERLARGGRRTVENYYDWRIAYRAWDQVYRCESCISSLTLPT